MKHETESKLLIISETLFVLLPIFIVIFYELLSHGVTSIFRSSNISFASIVLFGHTIVKFAMSLSKSESQKRWQLVALIISAIIVFGLIPSVIILILLLSVQCPATWIFWTQLGFLVISLVVTWVIGTIAQMMIDGHNPNS